MLYFTFHCLICWLTLLHWGVVNFISMQKSVSSVILSSIWLAMHFRKVNIDNKQ